MTHSHPATEAPLSRAAAYDQARKEFYDRRHYDEMEARIQREEAKVVGAQFGPSAMEIGMELENMAFEQWKSWAHRQVVMQDQARMVANASLGEGGTPTANKTLSDAVDSLDNGDVSGASSTSFALDGAPESRAPT